MQTDRASSQILSWEEHHIAEELQGDQKIPPGNRWNQEHKESAKTTIRSLCAILEILALPAWCPRRTTWKQGRDITRLAVIKAPFLLPGGEWIVGVCRLIEVQKWMWRSIKRKMFFGYFEKWFTSPKIHSMLSVLMKWKAKFER